VHFSTSLTRRPRPGAIGNQQMRREEGTDRARHEESNDRSVDAQQSVGGTLPPYQRKRRPRSMPAGTIAPEWLDTKGASIYLSVSQRSLEYWRSVQKGPPYTKVGRVIRYSVTALEAWMRAEEVTRG
jgi:hypothetical protein